jgi:RND family efflux transporter MFP subunit
MLALLLFGLAAGCGPRNTYVAPPAPDVTVAVPEQRSITVYHYYTGTTQASEVVQIRARVSGYLESIRFQDGSNILQGDLLFVIDQRPYKAQLDQDLADLANKKATVTQKEAIFKRTAALIRSGASSKEEFDVQKGDWEVAKAGVGQAEAKVRASQLNLDFTEIRAPLSGRIGRRMVDVGNLVVADNSILTTIARYDPMYAYFTVSEANYLAYLRRQRERPPGTREETEPPAPAVAAAALAGLPGSVEGSWGVLATVLLSQPPHYPVELALADEEGYPHSGYIDFADYTVDPNTGTLLLRAVFQNPVPYYLAPGLFVRLRVPIATRDQVLLVPDRALGTDQAGNFLLVVNKDNVVEQRSVKTGTLEGTMRVIEQGLKPGERFVVDGLQKARPGGKINPQPLK